MDNWQFGDDVSGQQSDNNIFLDVIKGANKKGRIYGLCTETEKYRHFTSAASSCMDVHLLVWLWMNEGFS